MLLNTIGMLQQLRVCMQYPRRQKRVLSQLPTCLTTLTIEQNYEKKNLWARSECAAEGSQVVHLVEPLDEQILRLEQRMSEVEARATSNQLGLSSERQYVDTNFSEMNETLTSLTHRMKILEKITKNWNRM